MTMRLIVWAFLIMLSTHSYAKARFPKLRSHKPSVVQPAQPAGLSVVEIGARLLKAHNVERSLLNAPPLVWSDTLAKGAAVWADHLAQTERFEHSPGDAEGENLWEGTKDRFTPEYMVGRWIEEKLNYQAGVFPSVSKTGKWEDVGHYTQLIWRTTTQIGCAKASSAKTDILVCRYAPPGNVEGERP
jgi:uncharacterized protein YkwD